MRISELAETTGVPVHTLKYYLREGLLMPGYAQSRTRSDYDQAHVERVRLIRALVEHGGVGIVGVRVILEAITAPAPARHDLLGLAHRALPAPFTERPVSEEVVKLVADLGWPVEPQCSAMSVLTSTVESARDAGVTLDPETLRGYARAMVDVATVDVAVATAAASPRKRCVRLSSAQSWSTPCSSPSDGSRNRLSAPGRDSGPLGPCNRDTARSTRAISARRPVEGLKLILAARSAHPPFRHGCPVLVAIICYPIRASRRRYSEPHATDRRQQGIEGAGRPAHASDPAGREPLSSDANLQGSTVKAQGAYRISGSGSDRKHGP